jgi:hypothetical protein
VSIDVTADRENTIWEPHGARIPFAAEDGKPSRRGSPVSQPPQPGYLAQQVSRVDLTVATRVVRCNPDSTLAGLGPDAVVCQDEFTQPGAGFKAVKPVTDRHNDHHHCPHPWPTGAAKSRIGRTSASRDSSAASPARSAKSEICCPGGTPTTVSVDGTQLARGTMEERCIRLQGWKT